MSNAEDPAVYIRRTRLLLESLERVRVDRIRRSPDTDISYLDTLIRNTKQRVAEVEDTLLKGAR